MRRKNSRPAINHYGSCHRWNSHQSFHKRYVWVTISDHQIPSKIQCIHICLKCIHTWFETSGFHRTPKIVSILSLYLPWNFQLNVFLLRPTSNATPLQPCWNCWHCCCRCSNLRQTSHDSMMVPPTVDFSPACNKYKAFQANLPLPYIDHRFVSIFSSDLRASPKMLERLSNLSNHWVWSLMWLHNHVSISLNVFLLLFSLLVTQNIAATCSLAIFWLRPPASDSVLWGKALGPCMAHLSLKPWFRCHGSCHRRNSYQSCHKWYAEISSLNVFLLRPTSSLAPLRPGWNCWHCCCGCSNLRRTSHDSMPVLPTNDLFLEPL